MSIIINDLSYGYPGRQNLFTGINFSAESQEKISIVGDNGAGKSTLLKLIIGLLTPLDGSVSCSSKPYYLPQHSGESGKSVAEILQVDDKLSALKAIEQGSLLQAHYDVLDDDWDIESRCRDALAKCGIFNVELDAPVDSLSGGEKTKVFLAGLFAHSPDILLLDEPTNHLDRAGRNLLYRFVEQSRALIVVVSHDIRLLNLMRITCELNSHGMKQYGGNYDFYRERKAIELAAIDADIREEEKTLRLARKQAQEVSHRQEKRSSSQGEKNKTQVPRIMRNTLRNSAENTASKLRDKHAEIIDESAEKLSELKRQKESLKELKPNLGDASLHAGKLLINAEEVNFAYENKSALWKTSVNFKLFAKDRILVSGNNGSGKTTFLNLLVGILEPTQGQVKRSNFEWIYIDQNYSNINVELSIVQLAEQYNVRNLEEHELKLRLNRFLFPSDTWDKKCRDLSGGEKMRLYLCCLMIKNQTPDLIILDEPSNNLDIASTQILIRTIKNYSGSLLIVSHDQYFVDEIGVTGLLDF